MAGDYNPFTTGAGYALYNTPTELLDRALALSPPAPTNGIGKIVTNSIGEKYRWLGGGDYEAVSLKDPSTPGGTRGAGDTGNGIDPTSGPVTAPVAQATAAPQSADMFQRLVKHYEGGDSYTKGYGGADLSNSPVDQYGFPIWEGNMGPQGISHAAGGYQFEPSTWHTYAKQLGITDFSPASQDKVFQAAYADQGTDPWLPYNTKLRAAYAAALGGKMLPDFGNARFASALMPKDPLGRAIALSQAPMLGGQQDDSGGDPAPDVSGAPSPMVAGGGAPPSPLSGIQDTLSQLGKLTSQGYGFNPSATLARMAAGFLGGKGPAQSLAGGFAGFGEGQQQGQADNLKLLSLAGGLQGTAIKNFTALVTAGVPPAQAAAVSGMHLPGSAQGAVGSNVNGDEFLKSLDPNMASQVKAIADGRMQFPSGFALKTPYWQNVLRNVAQYDPSFDAVNYNARAKTRADFTSGKSAQNVTSFNTAIGHLGTLAKAADDLNNGNYPMYNGIANYISQAKGDPRVTSFETAKQAVADELTRSFRGSGGNVADIVGWEKQLNAANSPDQLHAAVKQAVDLLASRINAVGEQYKKGLGTTASPLELLTPSARKTLVNIPGGNELISELGGNPNDYMSSQSPPSTAATAGRVIYGPNGQQMKLSPDGTRWVPAT